MSWHKKVNNIVILTFNFLKVFPNYSRYYINNVLYISYNQSNKLAFSGVMSKDVIITKIKYPKKIRYYHLFFAGIKTPNKQHLKYV